MGDSFKKWMAGIIAAVVVILVAMIAIGRIERKSTPAGSSSKSAALSKSTIRHTVNPSSSPDMPSSPRSAPKQEAEVQSEQQAGIKSAGMHSPATGAAQRTTPQTASPSKPSLFHTSAKTSMAAKQPSPIPSSQAQPPLQAQPLSQTTPQNYPPASTVAAVPASPHDVAANPAQTTSSASTTPAAMQASQPSGLLKTTGGVNVNGIFTRTTSLVYDNDQVITPGRNGALLTASGIAIALGPNAQLTAEPNEYMLDQGASKVNTSTGWKAKIKDWTVQPVDPRAETRYEVNWESDGVYVYARQNDLELISPCRRFRLEEGKAVKIPDPRRCGMMWLQNNPNWPKYVMAGAAATGAGVLIYLYTQPKMSGDSPIN